MSRQRYCKVCEGWHELDQPWPEACYRAPYGAPSSLQIVKDIEPYKTVAGDIANGGKSAVIMSRSEHRDFLRRNNYTEVGNDRIPTHREQLSQRERVQDIKRAMGEL